MAHPKRRSSQQRGAKRRTHYKATAATYSIDPTTGESHLRHHGHWSEGKLYYRGQVVLDNTAESNDASEA